MRKILFLGAGKKLSADIIEMYESSESCSIAAVVGPMALKNMLCEKGFNFNFTLDEPKDNENLKRLIAKANIDTIFSVQYRWIISKDVIEAVNGHAFNIHMALLPYYRGHHTTIFPILNGEKNCGATLHWMSPIVDTGYKCFDSLVPIDQEDSGLSLEAKVAEAAMDCARRFIDLLENNAQIPRIPIPEGGNFYTAQSIFPLKKIALGEDPQTIKRKARAFNYPPHEPAYFETNGERQYVIAGRGGWLPFFKKNKL